MSATFSHHDPLRPRHRRHRRGAKGLISPQWGDVGGVDNCVPNRRSTAWWRLRADLTSGA